MQVTIEHLNWRGEGVGDGQTFRNVLAGEKLTLQRDKFFRLHPSASHPSANIT